MHPAPKRAGLACGPARRSARTQGTPRGWERSAPAAHSGQGTIHGTATCPRPPVGWIRVGMSAALRAAAPRWRAPPARGDRGGRQSSHQAGRACTRGASSSRAGPSPARQGALDGGLRDPGRRADRPVGGPQAPHAPPAPGEISDQPGHHRDEREQQGEHDRDHEDEPLKLRAEVGQHGRSGHASGWMHPTPRPSRQTRRRARTPPRRIPPVKCCGRRAAGAYAYDARRALMAHSRGTR